MLGSLPMNDILVVLKYIDEIKEYDKEVSDDIFYGSLHDSFYDNLDDQNDSEETQYDNQSFDLYSIDNYSTEGYYFLTESR
jgi:hypothetical protein